MKVIEKKEDNITNKIMIISQLPCQIGKKSFNIKELKPKYHQGSIVYIINSKRINSKKLKINVLKVND